MRYKGLEAGHWVCRICGNGESNVAYHVREMMFGYQDRFTYFQCSACGCLQISEFPTDMSRYYPPGYYSFRADRLPDRASGILWRLKRHGHKARDTYVTFGRGVLGNLLFRLFPDTDIADVLRSTFPPGGIRELGLSPDSRILDVGSGSGPFLWPLAGAGFRRLVGIDAYAKADRVSLNGVQILRRTIHQMDGLWDVITFHHSFEHMRDQIETLRSVTRLLSDRGVCLIRVPTVSSYAWEHYREHWVQLDAPRHFFLHSLQSMRLLTAQAELSIDRHAYDSNALQFWGSEQYVRGIPLRSDRSYGVNADASIFSPDDVGRFMREAMTLNAQGRGDQVAFYLKRGGLR